MAVQSCSFTQAHCLMCPTPHGPMRFVGIKHAYGKSILGMGLSAFFLTYHRTTGVYVCSQFVWQLGDPRSRSHIRAPRESSLIMRTQQFRLRFCGKFHTRVREICVCTLCSFVLFLVLLCVCVSKTLQFS